VSGNTSILIMTLSCIHLKLDSLPSCSAFWSSLINKLAASIIHSTVLMFPLQIWSLKCKDHMINRHHQDFENLVLIGSLVKKNTSVGACPPKFKGLAPTKLELDSSMLRQSIPFSCRMVAEKCIYLLFVYCFFFYCLHQSSHSLLL